EILAGNTRLMEKAGITHPQPECAGTVIHCAISGAYAGYIVISDTVKDGAKNALAKLKALCGAKTVMLTGDRKTAGESVAKALGIDEVHAELLPDGKVSLVEKLYENKPAKSSLVYVGDGINDAPSLARADVGIAMGALGSDAAIEAADIVLMNDNIESLPLAVKIARKTHRIVMQNIVFALSVKAAVLIVSAIGFANMWLAVFADVGVSVIAILNAMRAMSKTHTT
ncbi:MAG: HAD-IC family P-type ATPase, partial [Oscillospiraceae bacterium]